MYTQIRSLIPEDLWMISPCTPPKMMVSSFLFIPSYYKWFKINIIDKDQQKLNETLLLKCITGTGLNTFF